MNGSLKSLATRAARAACRARRPMVRCEGPGGRLHGGHRSPFPQTPEAKAVDLKRLYGRRGNAHVALRQWQQAVDDYARLVNRGDNRRSLASKPGAGAAIRFAAASRPLTNWSAQRPKLAGSVGDLFIEDQDKDWPRGGGNLQPGHHGEDDRRPAALEAGSRLRDARRTGIPPRPTGRGPRPEIRTDPNCSPSSHDDWRPAARLRWRTVSLKRLEHSTSNCFRRTLKMTCSQRNSRNYSWINTKMGTPLGGLSQADGDEIGGRGRH